MIMLIGGNKEYIINVGMYVPPVEAPHLVVESASEEADPEERGAEGELGIELQRQDLVLLEQLGPARSESENITFMAANCVALRE